MKTEGVVYFDGGIREGLCAYGWILCDPANEAIIMASGNKTCGRETSNISEYRGLIASLRGAILHGIDIVHIIGDSQLVVKQITGAFKTNKQELKEHRDYVLKLLEKFESYTIKWVPRNQNKRADALVNEVFKRRRNKCPKKQSKRR